MTIQFQIGKTYQTRSLCDHDVIIGAKVLERTPKTVTVETRRGVKTFRPRLISGTETIEPWGSYSMCPVIWAA